MKKQKWETASEENDVVKTLDSFCAKVKAIRRESASLIQTFDRKKCQDNSEPKNYEADESENDVDVSTSYCQKRCGACIGTNSKYRLKNEESDDNTSRIPPWRIKKIIIYPEDDERGSPVTIIKNYEADERALVGDFENGFSYIATCTQKLVPVKKCGKADCDKHRNSDEYG